MVFVKQTNMKRIVCIVLAGFAFTMAKAQITAATDSAGTGKVTVIKDSRLDDLAKKEAGFNETMNMSTKAGKGYRLMVLSTNDRPLAMKVRAQLLQYYPDQKIYMIYQPPNIKLKFGDYPEKADAENIRKDIIRNKLVTGNIYIVPDRIEIKPDKNKDANNGDK
jgi:hypothetical protein